MAATEARAAWQRAANRCFVQEDAKRAPRLASCPSSSSSKPQSDKGPNDTESGPGYPSTGFTPLNCNSSKSNLPPDTKWWLQLQSNFGHPNDFTYEQLNALEVELESLRAEEVNPTSKLPEDSPIIAEELMDLDPLDELISNSEKLFDMESPWMGSEKSEPWWRTADKDELANLVAQKSLEHIENCDLPPPQTMHVRRAPFGCLESFDHQGGIFSSLDRKAPTCGSVNRTQWDSGERGHSLYGSNKPFSSSSTNSPSTTNKDPKETQHTTESEPSKAQLLEAIHHSQTRAREAEKAAQQAHSEKEHIIKLFFKQASHLFAYKQWLQLLQLETLRLHLKNKDQPICTLFPMVLPWMPYKDRQSKKKKDNKAKKGKCGPPRCDICKCAVAFAVGLVLASAGLLLGWTMGWLIPPMF